MMMLAALLLSQTPTAKALERIWKPGEKRRYEIRLETSTEAGRVANRYRLELLAPKPLPETGPVPVAGEMRDLDIELNGKLVRKRGSFGQLRLDFAPTGMPEGIVFGGDTPLMFPLLAWYLPTEIGADGAFIVERVVVDGGFLLTGTGTEAREGRRTRVTSSLRLHKNEEEVGSLTMSAFVDTKSGALIEADGTARMTSGDIAFSIR